MSRDMCLRCLGTCVSGAELGQRPWREVLNAWWPRLLPGVVAAATHGVIRVGHAVRALLADGDDPSQLGKHLLEVPAAAASALSRP